MSISFNLNLRFVPQLFAVSSVSWILWRIFRAYVKPSLDNIPGPKSKSFLKGHFPQLFNVNAWGFHEELAEKYGNVIRLKGSFAENILYVFDPKALHHIFIKDQYTYEETASFLAGNNLVFGAGLSSTMGDHHRKQRKMLNPVFSIAHMRDMIPTFYGVTYKLRDAFLHKVKNAPQEIDVLSWMTRTALELIGQSGLGYSFDPLTEDGQEHPYSISVKRLVPVALKFLFLRQYLLDILVKIGTPRFRRFVVDILPWENLHQIRDIVDIMYNTSVEIFESKKKALQEGDEALAQKIGRGKDIISILMKANMSASEKDKLPDSELIGQMSAFTFAAMDTTSSALSRILDLLAEHQDVQDKLRQEIREARKVHGDMSYDQLVALPYLDAVCRETLRLYPPVSQLFRVARHDIALPLSTPIKGNDGKYLEEILVPKDTKVLISVISSNRNPEIWGPDAGEWKPERWLSPLPETVASAHIPGIYSHLMTFIGGGRACIGFKFSQLEMKVVISLLLETFSFSQPTDKKVTWRMTGIATPGVGNSDDPMQSQLPMIVSMAK